jgi:hypothetical protein
MNTKNLWSLGAFALALVAVLGAKCPSIPSIQDRAVELVVTGSSVVGPFEARGNDVADDGQVDLVTEYDIAGTLDDAGIDLSDVEEITVRQVEVRVSKPDPNDERQIVGGTVMVSRVAGGAGTNCPTGISATVVSNWTGVVNAYQNFSPENVEVSEDGIGFLNCLLAEYLEALQNGTNPTNMVVSYEVDGTTTPAGDADFDWEVRIWINIVGTIRTDVLG